MAANVIHLVAPYYMTACGKDTARWKDRALKCSNQIKFVTCPHCLANQAFDCIKQLDSVKGSLRTIADLNDQLKDVVEGPVIVRD